ncbi:MAG: hypothetical protein SNJ79_06595 [Sphingomonadaceae bacterium]
MSICRKQEQAALSHDEWTFVATTHHPQLGGLSDQELASARARLRELHGKERDFTAHKGRVARGTAEPRGGSFPGTIERPRFRKQVFAQALRRVNSEVERRAAEAKRQAALEAQKAVLAGKREALSRRPANVATARTGKPPRAGAPPRGRGGGHVAGKRVGSTSAQGKRAQAKRDR